MRSPRIAPVMSPHAKNVAILVLTFVALTIWSWRKWCDPVVDFGRELYQPWQITTGKVLYRDIAVLFGPFSQYLNALWFTLFGVSVTTLALCNLAILAATTGGIYYLFVSACGPAAAPVTAVVMLILFGFSQYVSPGNYNFVCPYSHEATHGTAAAVATMIGLYRGGRDRRLVWFALGGLCFGVVWLTKAEIALAITATAVVGLVCLGFLVPVRVMVARAALFVVAAMVPALIFLAYFSAHMPWWQAVGAVGGSWTVILTSGVTHGVFYRQGMGLDAPVENAVRMGRTFLGFGVFVGVLAAVDARWPWTMPRSRAISIARRLTRLVVLIGSVFLVPWTEFPRALPLLSLAGIVIFSVMFIRCRSDGGRAASLLPLVMWSVFGFVLLAKIGLNARVYHYGFYLAMPATLLTVVGVVWLLPRWLQDGRGQGEIFRAVATLVLVGGVTVHVGVSHGFYRLKDFQLGSGSDRLVTFGPKVRWQEAGVAQVLERLEAVPRDATVAVVPEGVIINYLSRRENPTGYINLMPPEMEAFGEAVIREAFVAAAPDYIVLLHKDMSEYGVGVFGAEAGYGRALLDWIRGHYTSVEILGHRPLTAGGSGIEILRAASEPGRPHSGSLVTTRSR